MSFDRFFPPTIKEKKCWPSVRPTLFLPLMRGYYYSALVTFSTSKAIAKFLAGHLAVKGLLRRTSCCKRREARLPFRIFQVIFQVIDGKSCNEGFLGLLSYYQEEQTFYQLQTKLMKHGHRCHHFRSYHYSIYASSV
jgi:hypothetical protein